jgi:hypothetical protein
MVRVTAFGHREDFTTVHAPDVIYVPRKRVVLPAGWVWDNPLSMHLLGYHPHAAYGIRKKAENGDSGAQAMYDENGDIITGGLSAGTADRVSTQASGSGHRAADVEPFNQAYALDQYYGGDKFRRMYIEVRPPNTSKKARPNPVD